MSRRIVPCFTCRKPIIYALWREAPVYEVDCDRCMAERKKYPNYSVDAIERDYRADGIENARRMRLDARRAAKGGGM